MKYCAVCGAELPSNSGPNRKYCSTKCRRAAEAQEPNKKAAIQKRAKKINAVAQAVYCAYGYKCALCGWQASAKVITHNGKIFYSHGNEIHHITPARENGTEEASNIILLCPNHHTQADMGLISQEELRKHTREYVLTEKEKGKAINDCADIIASFIF